MSRRFLFSLAASAAIGALSPGAGASPLFELVGAASGTGGYNARATGAGAASAYFNPALLSRSEQAFELGVFVLSDQIGMTLDARTHGNVPLIVGGRTLVDPSSDPISNQTVPTEWLQFGCRTGTCTPPFEARPRQAAGSSGNVNAYASIGLVSRLIKDRLVIGLHALVPIGDFTKAYSFYNDEREQVFSNSLHPEMYADRLSAMSLAFGASSRIIDRLSAGVSFTLAVAANASSYNYVREAADYNKLLMSNDIHVRAGVSPQFGLAYDVLDRLRLTATAHTPQSFDVNFRIRATLPDGKESRATRHEVYSYMPWQLGLGASADVVKSEQHTVSVVGNVKYALWSTYLDRHGESPGRQGNQFEFKDVFSETLGVRYSRGNWMGFLDATYVPTPVPPQTGRTNYVDNDRLGGVLGGEYRFSIAKVPFKVGLQTQVQRLIPRYQRKDDALIVDELPDGTIDSINQQPVASAPGLQTNNPGWPGFKSEGWITGGSLTATLMY